MKVCKTHIAVTIMPIEIRIVTYGSEFMNFSFTNSNMPAMNDAVEMNAPIMKLTWTTLHAVVLLFALLSRK